MTSSAERRLIRNSGGMRSCGVSWHTAHLCLYNSAPSGEVAACCCWELEETAGKTNIKKFIAANKTPPRILPGVFILRRGFAFRLAEPGVAEICVRPAVD